MMMQDICQNTSFYYAIIARMILITGGTGFIGMELINQCLDSSRPFRLLIHPEEPTPKLPKGVQFDAAICAFSDERGLKAVLQDVEAVYFISIADQSTANLNLQQTEISEIESFTHAAQQAGVNRFFYLSHLGADRASAFDMLKAKGIAEHIIKEAGIPYTIIRSSIVYGKGDVFTENLARLIRYFPLRVPIPGDGNVTLQPLWVRDLATCMLWALDLPATENSIIEIGGQEYFTLLEILELIARRMGKKRNFFAVNSRQLHRWLRLMQGLHHDFPRTTYWMDYFIENQICALDSIPRIFGINPARFHQNIDYLIPQTKGI